MLFGIYESSSSRDFFFGGSSASGKCTYSQSLRVHLGCLKQGLYGCFFPTEKRWLHMEILALSFLFEATLLLEAADPGCLLVLALDCNVKKMVEQDLRTKLNRELYTSFFFHRGWSAVNGQRVIELRAPGYTTLSILFA